MPQQILRTKGKMSTLTLKDESAPFGGAVVDTVIDWVNQISWKPLQADTHVSPDGKQIDIRIKSKGTHPHREKRPILDTGNITVTMTNDPAIPDKVEPVLYGD